MYNIVILIPRKALIKKGHRCHKFDKAVNVCVRAVITKHHRLDGRSERNLFLQLLQVSNPRLKCEQFVSSGLSPRLADTTFLVIFYLSVLHVQTQIPVLQEYQLDRIKALSNGSHL